MVALVALALGAAACGSDDGLTDERGDLDEDVDSVPGATVDSPAFSESTEPPIGVPPFGTVSIQGEVYPVDADSTVVDDYAVETENSTARGTADFDDGTITFDMTC